MTLKRYFIIGTDTDCGKTYVTALLADAFRRMACSVRAIKPVASGCVERNGIWISEDALYLDAEHHHNPLFLRLKRPIAPHLAAVEEGVVLSAEAIASVCDSIDQTNLDYLFIEGAGGLMVPLNEKETWIDFLVQTRIPVILVVGMRLGCLNYALLTELALKHHEIECVGWIANCLDPEVLALEQNIDTLSGRLSFPLLGTVAFEGREVGLPQTGTQPTVLEQT